MTNFLNRKKLHAIIPLSERTIYDMEKRGAFPKRIALTSRCVVWDEAEAMAWLESRAYVAESAEREKRDAERAAKRSAK